MSDVKLEPCPFCGGPGMERPLDSGDWEVGCSNPDCRIMPSIYTETATEGVTAWNRRALSPDAEEMRTALEPQDLSTCPKCKGQRTREVGVVGVSVNWSCDACGHTWQHVTPAAPPSDWAPTHRHYKGGLYRVLFEALDEPTAKAVVVYQSKDGDTWVRDKDVFNERLPDGRLRFEPINVAPQTPAAPAEEE